MPVLSERQRKDTALPINCSVLLQELGRHVERVIYNSKANNPDCPEAAKVRPRIFAIHL